MEIERKQNTHRLFWHNLFVHWNAAVKTFIYWNFLLYSFGICFTVTDSPYSERMERKASIRRFLSEQFRDDKKKENKEKEKESKESKENKENIANANASSTASTSSSATAASSDAPKSNTETKTKSSAYRLFRTVSSSVYVRVCVCVLYKLLN